MGRAALLTHKHVWHGDRPSEVRCAEHCCTAKPTKADIEKVRSDTAARQALRQTLVMGHERPA